MEKKLAYSPRFRGLIMGCSALCAAMPAAAMPMGGPRGGFTREISEQEHALRQREAGEIRPFGELLSRAQNVGRGEYLGVEPDLASGTYRFKFLRAGANVVWVDVDGRTGKVLSARQ